ncbi:hypothetical protein DYQ86_09965 [Acidobacteria bacterium AB60]|nr:hypothetical protein DYQ86_09965 [Acidobacteria bacterium AB60]
MRKTTFVAGFSSLLLLCIAHNLAAATPPKNSGSQLVIVFKDGHRQSFSLSDIERIEFPGATASASADTQPYNPNWPPRGRYFGKWEAGDGAGSTFTITLKESGDAFRSIGDMHGKWVYVNGEAHITWDDGSMDALRKVGSRFQKSAYRAGKSFDDKPDNTAEAHNTSHQPI